MHKLMTLANAAALILLSASAYAADTSDSPARKQWHQSIQAGYQTLATEANRFHTAAHDYCKSPGPDARAVAEQAWIDAFLAWQKVRFVDFGPIENNNLAWQFQFWPDPKNLIARKAAFLLESTEPVSPEVIARSGVAVQGFPMAEYLLYDEPLNASEDALPAPKTCDLLSAVAKHIATNSKQLSNQWQSFRKHYLTTNPYRDTTIRSAMTALEILEQRRLAQPMGMRGNDKRSAYAADAWRSGTSLMTTEATLQGLGQHFLPGLTLLLKNSNRPELAQRIERQFDEVLENFPGLHSPMVTLLSESDAFSRLQNFYVDVSQLTTLVNDQAAVELGVVRGFNSSDGD